MCLPRGRARRALAASRSAAEAAEPGAHAAASPSRVVTENSTKESMRAAAGVAMAGHSCAAADPVAATAGLNREGAGRKVSGRCEKAVTGGSG